MDINIPAPNGYLLLKKTEYPDLKPLGEDKEQKKEVTYCYARGDEIRFVQDKNHVFVRSFLSQVLFHTSTPRS